jgi:hypothetical protein
MRNLFACVALPFIVGGVSAEEPKRFVDRTPPARMPLEHTAARAGNPTAVSRLAILTPAPGVAGGDVNGVYGTDNVGVFRRYARIFRAPSADPSRGPSVADNYRTDAAPVKDVFALRPLRTAVIEAREVGHPHR